MKTKGSTAWVFTTMVAVVLFMAACGNSQKKKEHDDLERQIFMDTEENSMRVC